MSRKEKLAEEYADKCSPNNTRPSIGSTKSLEIGMRSLWEAERDSFLAGYAACEQDAKGLVDGANAVDAFFASDFSKTHPITKLRLGLRMWKERGE